MSPDELKTLQRGHFILAKTGCRPMQTQLPFFLQWGIQFGQPYEVQEQSARPVAYVDRFELEREIVHRRDEDSDDWDDYVLPSNPYMRAGRMPSEENILKEHKKVSFRPPLRTD